MGLSISVGDYAAAIREGDDADWIADQLAIINNVLKRHSLPDHVEPTDVPEINYASCVGFPYSFLHYLRRIYARRRLGKNSEPVRGDDISAEDDADIQKVANEADSHLLFHSDCDGFYLPLDFSSPIEDEELPGGIVGSTHGLLKELVEIAPLIGVELINGTPSAAALAGLEAFDESHPYYIERVAWHCLYENCQLSLEHGSAVSFG